MSQHTFNAQRPFWEAFFISTTNNPRDHVAILAHASPAHGMDQRCYVLHTPNNHMQTRTTITRMRGQTETGLEVATLDWMLGRFLGTAHIGDREVLMGDLVDRTGAASPELRSFMSTSSDGSAVRCTWARQPDGSYQLWSSGTYLAEYQPTQEHIAGIGMSWGTMRYWFRPEQLFLDAIITVSINKWIDLQGL